MAKRSTDWMTVREVVSVTHVPSTKTLDIEVREQGKRMLHLRMTRKSAKMLRNLLEIAT